MSLVKIIKWPRRASAPDIQQVDSKEIYAPTKKHLTRRNTEEAIPLPRSRSVIHKAMPKCYVKGLNRVASENLLQDQPVGTYLLRDRESSSTPGSYTLTMRDKNIQCRHYKIDTDPEHHLLSICGYEDCYFSSLEKLLDNFVEKQTELCMMPYTGGSTNDDPPEGLYVSMDDNVSPYQSMDSDCTRRSSHPSPTARTTLSYENIVKNKVMPRRPPPHKPSETADIRSHCYENIPTKPQANSPTSDFRLTCPYENLPPISENQVPLPPMRQPVMGGVPNKDRRISLPIQWPNECLLRQPPPPLPERPHKSVPYENLPGRGSFTIDSAASNQQRRHPFRRSHTVEKDTKF